MARSFYSTPLHDLEFSVVDLETTGLSPKKDRILQIGVVRVGPGSIRGLGWETTVYPGRRVRVPREILGLTGLDEHDLQLAPPIEKCLREFARRVEGTVLAGHNLGPFDLRFLLGAAEATGVDLPVLPFVDTLAVSRRLRPWQENHRLPTCLETYGLTPPPGRQHDALHDSRATAALLDHQLEELGGHGVETLGDLARFLTGRNEDKRTRYIPRNAAGR